MTDTTTEPAFVGETRMLIDGKLVEAAQGKQFDNINPTTEDVLGQVADVSSEDMDVAIGAARRAFDTTDWATNKELRKRCLLQLQEALVAEQEQIRAELIAEAGAPLLITYGPHLDGPLEEALLWPAEMIDRFEWERQLKDAAPFGMPSRRFVLKEAIGVVGAITPWNFPFEITIGKLGQALATGNTVVLKPAPDTPWTATRFGRLIAEKTDIPPGVVNVVTSSDHMVGEQLVIDPRVDLISFTGSSVTGRRIMEKGAATLKRVFLELGGKSAMLVAPSADLEAVVPGAAMVCVHGGQGCALHTRLSVPRARYDEAVDIVAAAMEAMTYGDPSNPENFQGPQISALQRERILGYIQRGVDEGARLVLGGGRPAQFPKGYFVEPTLFVDVNNQMTIAREEIFGPVQTVIVYEDLDDAINITNDSPFGLSAQVAAGTEEEGWAIARRLRTGTVGVNGGIFYGADAPYGGYKTSGIGRQNGVEGFNQYLETKVVATPGE